MPSRDSSSSSSTITTNLPPPDLKGNNSTNKPFNVSAITETDYSNSSINVSARNDPSSLTTQVPDSSSTNDYNNNSNDNDKNNNSTPKFLNEDEQDNLILGMVLDKFIVWSSITLVIFASAIAACLLICCCRKGFLANSCSDRSSSEGRIYANGHLPSMYGDTNGSEAREMQLFIDRVGDVENGTKIGSVSPESKPLTTKLNGNGNHVKSNIKTNGSLISSHKYPNKSNSKGEKMCPKSKGAESWLGKGDDAI